MAVLWLFYFLWLFGIVCGRLVHFPVCGIFGMLFQEKSGNPEHGPDPWPR
jgi:hypothetical protein